MSKQDLQFWLLDNASFKEKLNRLTLESVQNQFKNLKYKNLNSDEHDWNYLLFCASILAQSDNGSCQDAALRIAQATLESKQTKQAQKDAATIVLDSLANKPAIKLALKRNLIETNITDRLPIELARDWVKRSFENSITLTNFSSLSVNKFQKCA